MTDHDPSPYLAKANGVRTERAALKRKLKEGRTTLADALQDPAAQGMKVYDLLCYLPVYGPSKSKGRLHRAEVAARTLIRALPCSESTKVSALGERRTKELLRLVLERYNV